MKPRLCSDTSLLGGCEVVECRQYSCGVLDAFTRGECTRVLTELTPQELAAAPAAVRRSG